MYDCHVCGNEIERSRVVCPFCGNQVDRSELPASRNFAHKTVNLERGRPVAEVALRRMSEALKEAHRSGITVLTFIHGYGSSGKGGVIRSECRKNLEYLKSKGTIGEVIAGEDYCKRSGVVKGLLRRYPQLASDRNLSAGNRGITVIVL